MIYPAISIRQPWAFAILNLGKDIENRSWRFPLKYLNVPVLIHAGKSIDEEAVLFLRKAHFVIPNDLKTGGIVGALIFEGLNNYRANRSKWSEHGLENWAIERAWPVPFHPCKGQLGFFQVDYPHGIEGLK